MRQRAALLLMVSSLASACSEYEVGGGVGGTQAAVGGGGAGGMAGSTGIGGSAGAGGSSGSSSSGGTGGNAVPPAPALLPGTPGVACPAEIDGALDAADRNQTGRHSRIPPIATCGTTKVFPATAADPSNPHLYDVYRFSNPAAAAACFSFTLSYGAGVIQPASDAGLDAAIADAGANADASASRAAPAKYLTAYSTFYPTDLSLGYVGDVGDDLASPQTMGITVPAGGTIDVVVYAIEIAPAGVGPYKLSCSTQ